MRNSVVGVFDNYSKAQQVASELEEAGFAASDVEIICNNDRVSEGKGEDFIEKISKFFRSLTAPSGQDESEYSDDRQYYSQFLENGRAVVIVKAEDDSTLNRATSILKHHGALDPVTDSTSGTGVKTQASQAIPVIKEELKVGKRAVLQGGIRVYSHVSETPIEETVRLRDEQVRVERRSVNRPATAAELSNAGNQSIELTETSEEPIISKEARVVEEVILTKEVKERAKTVRDKVRQTEVNVTPLDPKGSTISEKEVGGTDSDRDFRSHYQTNFASGGGRYEDYEPAYNFGKSATTDERYRGKKFDDVEPALRGEYESSYPGDLWNKVKAAVRYGWDRVSHGLSRGRSAS